MATLAPKLPYTHPFAGGFPYRGSQRLPSDPDALTYLAAVAAADGAPVETAVAVAVDDFFRGTKADGTFGALKASCILCGARTLAGALTPLAGVAPTNYNFVDADYNRETGLVGNGSTKYLDSGRANDDDPKDDKHMACYHSAAGSPPEALIGSIIRTPALSVSQVFLAQTPSVGAGINAPANKEENGIAGTGIVGAVRNAGTQALYFAGNSYDEERASNDHHSLNAFVFARNDEGAVSFASDATLAFYSIGESLDLALLDTRVTALVQRIQLSLSTGLDASGYDDATVAYLLAAYNNGATLA